MPASLLLFVLGLVLLAKGADFLVTGASSLAARLRVPPLVVGLSLVAMGTSLPELVVNVFSSVEGKNDIAIGNVVGSNIVNALFILGISAAVYPIAARRNTAWREIPFVLLVSAILAVLFFDEELGGGPSGLSRGDGIILLIFWCFFMFYLFAASKEGSAADAGPPPAGAAKTAALIAGGLAGLVAGGALVVDSASAIARSLGVGEKVIALTIVSIGTSLPELVTSVVAARRRQEGIALGNIVGSNIFNILFILGVSAVIAPIRVDAAAYRLDFAALMASSIVIFGSMVFLKKNLITRLEGCLMAAAYLGYLTYLVATA